MAHYGFWDLLLLVAVPAQATVMAYLHAPRWKAFLLSIPIPFSISYLAVGRPVSAHQVVALALLLAYTHGVHLLRNRLGVPIVPSIVVAAVGYCGLSAALAPLVPTGEPAFWVALGAVVTLALALYLGTPHRIEPGHRTPLPVWIKFPAVLLVIGGILAIKQQLQGFLSLFPMVGVITSYEARHSLRTMARQIPVIMITLAPMLVVLHLAQPRLGAGGALAAGWAVFLPALYLVTRHQWAGQDRHVRRNTAAPTAGTASP